MMRARGVGAKTNGPFRVGGVFCLSAVGLLLGGCAEPPAAPVETEDVSTPPEASAPVSDFQQFTLTLPYGDPDAGREAFVDLQCTVCHEVAGEEEFPAPYGDYQGPTLTSVLASRPPEYVATAMIAPSHSISLEVSDELRARMGGQPSPMADYSYAMSVRQMLDLLAFLTTLEE